LAQVALKSWYSVRCASMDASMVRTYLSPYGYEAASHSEWQTLPSECQRRPTLQMRMVGHSKKGMSTLYKFHCTFCAEEPPLSLEWSFEKQLDKLRSGLHDVAKQELGKAYAEKFAEAPFAQRGGPKGTSERLYVWLNTLVTCVNSGDASPSLVSQLLLFADSPAQPSHEAVAKAMDEVVEDVSSVVQSQEKDGAPESHVTEVPRENPLTPSTIDTETEGVAQVDSTPPSQEPVGGETSVGRGELGTNQSPTVAVSPPSTQPGPESEGTGDPELAKLKGLLEPYGYEVLDLSTWATSPAAGPQVHIEVTTHEKSGRGTLYTLLCGFVAPDVNEECDWLVKRTLAHLRGLHDDVKASLATYDLAFCDTPFAMKHGPPGTTGRLQAWTERLAQKMNEGQASPELVGRVFSFLELPSRASQNARTSAASTVVEAVPQPVEPEESPCVEERVDTASCEQLEQAVSSEVGDEQSPSDKGREHTRVSSESDSNDGESEAVKGTVGLKIHKWFAKLKVKLRVLQHGHGHQSV